MITNKISMLAGGLVVPIMGAKKIRSNNIASELNNQRMMIGAQSGVLPDFNKNFPQTQTSNIFHINVNQKLGSSYDRHKEPCKCPKVLIADDEPFNLIALEGLLH